MNDLERHALQLIGENLDSPDVFTDDDTGLAQIRASVNDAVQELCMVSGSYTKTYHLTTLEDRQFYRISPQVDYFAYVVEVWDRTNGRKLDQLDVATMAKIDPLFLQTNGTPLFYGLCGLEHVWIAPYPSAKGQVLELRSVMIPAPYTRDDDPVKVRENFRNAAVYLAVSEYHASRGDASRATEYLEQYLEAAGLMQLSPQTAERQFQMQNPRRNPRAWTY